MTMFQIILFLFLGGAQAISPEIISFTLSPTGKFQPRQRGSLRFRCSTRAATRIDFMKNGVILLNNNDRRLSRSGNSLSISNLDYSRDDGIYRCRASNSRGTVLSVSINLKVAVLGNFRPPFQVSSPTREIIVTIGRAAKLSCPSHTYTYPREIIWGNAPRVGQARGLTSSRRRFQLSNGDYFFTYITKEDESEINNQLDGVSCFLYHNGPYVQSVRFKLNGANRNRLDKKAKVNFKTYDVADWETITMHILPNISRSKGNLIMKFALRGNTSPRLQEGIPANTDVIRGEEVSFFCAASGKPTPNIEWYYNGRRISRSNFDYIISTAGNKLTIRNAGERYAGKYKCDISNSQGKVSSEGSLNVRAPPRWQRRLDAVTARQTGNVQFTCMATGSGTISYTWYKNGNLINRSNGTYTVSGGSLTIRNVNSASYGMVQCFAKSQYGEIKSSAFLNVEGAVIPTDPDTTDTDDKLHFGYVILIVGGGSLLFGGTAAAVYYYRY